MFFGIKKVKVHCVLLESEMVQITSATSSGFFGIHVYQHVPHLKPFTSRPLNTPVRAEIKTKHLSVCSVLVFLGNLFFFLRIFKSSQVEAT